MARWNKTDADAYRRRYVIVGSRIAGLAAAETVRQHDASAEITKSSCPTAST